jgi:glycosyltransferase involved in cell wall biosynthesis
VPVVATAIGGTDELVSSATGTLVAPADPRALADGIRALLADRDGAARRAATARAHVLTKHSADAMVASMSALYESLLAR